VYVHLYQACVRLSLIHGVLPVCIQLDFNIAKNKLIKTQVYIFFCICVNFSDILPLGSCTLMDTVHMFGWFLEPVMKSSRCITWQYCVWEREHKYAGFWLQKSTKCLLAWRILGTWITENHCVFLHWLRGPLLPMRRAFSSPFEIKWLILCIWGHLFMEKKKWGDDPDWWSWLFK
jgi:hypothetical protein